jgi:hypothetical protein
VDGRFIVAGLTLVLPAVLVAVTVGYFSNNVIAMLILFSVMLLGCLYLLSYTDAFTGAPLQS